MDQIPYQILFLLLCIAALAYLNRNNFGGVAQKVGGVYLPKPVIIGAICIIGGLFLWIAFNIILMQFT